MATINYKNSKGSMEELPIIINYNPKTAYDLAVECGFIGTMEEWLKSLAYDDTKLLEQFNTLDQGLQIHKNNISQDIQNYKNNKNLEINADLENYKTSTTQNIQDYKNIKDVEIKQELNKYTSEKNLEITESLEIYKRNSDLEINKNLEAYKSAKDTEINQYKTTKDLEINTYINNKNTELDKYISDKNIEINKDLENYKSDASQTVEGNYISLANTIGGYINNIEILGNTIQGTDLSDIQSVGTLRQDGLYEISITSYGKNLFSGWEQGAINDLGVPVPSTSDVRSDFKKVKPNTNYTCSNAGVLRSTYVFYYDKNKNFIKKNDSSPNFITPDNAYYIKVAGTILNRDKFQIEEGTVATTYEPYQASKSHIVLPCQLEKVGDVRDRLFRRKDGIWCIEKNVDSRILDGSEGGWSKRNDGDGVTTMSFHSQFSGIRPKSLVISDKFPLDGVSSTNGVEGVSIDNTTFLIEIQKNKLPSADLNGFKTWLMQNHLLIKYASASPQIIELPLDTQIALNSFLGTTNIFTEDTVIEPTIKATVPKSLGASINSLVNKTDNLSQRLENVETLKEGQELEVTTDKGYVVCENTSNGQIEGLKIEGKTLVNLVKSVNNVANRITLNQNLVVGKQYTIMFNITASIAGSELLIEENRSWCALKNIPLNQGVNNKVALLTIPTGYAGDNDLLFSVRGASATFTNLSNVLILEGDFTSHTQNPPSYFEGLKSVGDTSDKIEVLSCGKNLFDKQQHFYPRGLNANGTWYNSDSVQFGIKEVRVNSNTPHIISGEGLDRNTIAFLNDKKEIIEIFIGYKFTTPPTCKYINAYLSTNSSIVKNVQLEEGEIATSYELYKENKKQILYQTKEGNYEKPILRGMPNGSKDTIEKHSDSKYYYHKRCESFILNGSNDESWVINGNVAGYHSWVCNNIIAEKNSIGVISDKFISQTGDNEHIRLSTISGKIIINILSTKLSTQDAQGFKTWLQANPVTVVYQLVTEEIYECLNLDLDSYEGETNVICNSGAISPKITFKIANHIGNTISVLKNKMNYLEDKVIGMLKLVLAGDVQSLAYELYPQDFEEEEFENAETVEGTELL